MIKRRQNGNGNHGEPVGELAKKLNLPIGALIFCANDERLRAIVMIWPHLSRGARSEIYRVMLKYYYRMLREEAPPI